MAVFLEREASVKKKNFLLVVCELFVLNALSVRNTNNLVPTTENIEVRRVLGIGCARKNSEMFVSVTQ
jgi:hypothetical protein